MEREAPPSCDDCLVSMTLRHLLVECLSIGDFRLSYLFGWEMLTSVYLRFAERRLVMWEGEPSFQWRRLISTRCNLGGLVLPFYIGQHITPAVALQWFFFFAFQSIIQSLQTVPDKAFHLFIDILLPLIPPLLINKFCNCPTHYM